jgi:hypothetical protein
MKLMLGNTPVKKMMIHNDTQDATMVASDLQAGVTCYAKGQKVTGTGKCFSFATYGSMPTNFPLPISSGINIIRVASVEYPVQMLMPLGSMKNTDFSATQTVANVTINNISFPITVIVSSGVLTVGCSETIELELFYGKDEYV